MSKQVVKAVALGLMVFAGSQVARAQTWYRVNLDVEVLNLTLDGSTDAYHTGEIQLSPYAGNDPGGLPASESPAGVVASPSNSPLGGSAILHTVCTDILGSLNAGWAYKFTTTPFAGQTGQNPNPWGTGAGMAAQAIQNAAYLYDGLKTTLSLGTTQQKAAIQLAIWAALYDTAAVNDWANALTSGRLSYSSGDNTAAGLATAYLLAAFGLNGNSPTSFDGDLLLATNPSINAQGLLVPVPEPTTVLAGMLLLLPFGASTVRHLRRSSAQSAGSATV